VSNEEAEGTAKLLTRAREALEQYMEVFVDDDGALTFRHADVPCAVQAMLLAEGLYVLSITCVVAWDLPDDVDTAARAAERGGLALFGTVNVTRNNGLMDVTLRYTFPAEGLDPVALGTMFMLVVSGASQLRNDLVGSRP
jgi:hypothetical protein